MKRELTYEDAARLIAERAEQLAKDKRVRQELLKRYNAGVSIEDLQKEMINAAIYTLYVPINKR